MFHDLTTLLFPRFCQSCSAVLLKNEWVVCTLCLHELPVTNYHNDNENDTAKVFYGRINIEHATSLLVFQKESRVQQLIHNLKYRRQEEVGAFLGKWMGEELKNLPEFSEITVVVPVPLHKSKLKQRGYNQVEEFGIKIAEALNVPYVNDVLLKVNFSQSQTLRSRFTRWGSLEETFEIVQSEKLQNSHILIVDDVVTTGATLEACAEKLLGIPGVKVSVATMAITS